MKTKIVQKTESIENITNETFIFCIELKKGFIKRDLTQLGITDYSFTNVSSLIEGMTLDQLEQSGLNTIIFVNGEEKISSKMNKIIEQIISELPSSTASTEIETIFSNKRLSRDYFDNAIIDVAIKNSMSSVSLLDIFDDGSCVSLYTFDDNTADTSGINNGAATNVTYVPGKFGQAAKFIADWYPTQFAHSVSSGVTIDTSTLAYKTQFSMSGWMYSSDTSKPTIFTAMDYTGKRLFALYFTKTDTTDYFYSNIPSQVDSIRFYSAGNNNIDKTLFTPFNFPLNQWNHVVLTFDSSSTAWTVYVNGVQQARYTDPSFTITGEANQGDKQGIGCQTYCNITSGDIFDQFRIFNKALTQAEVTTLFNEK